MHDAVDTVAHEESWHVCTGWTGFRPLDRGSRDETRTRQGGSHADWHDCDGDRSAPLAPAERKQLDTIMFEGYKGWHDTVYLKLGASIGEARRLDAGPPEQLSLYLWQTGRPLYH